MDPLESDWLGNGMTCATLPGETSSSSKLTTSMALPLFAFMRMKPLSSSTCNWCLTDDGLLSPAASPISRNEGANPLLDEMFFDGAKHLALTVGQRAFIRTLGILFGREWDGAHGGLLSGLRQA